MLNKSKCIVFDLDWTLCQLWDSANPYNHDGEEITIQAMEYIYNKIDCFNDDRIIILTGRKRKEYGRCTEEWLYNNKLNYDELIMQEWSTAEKNHIYKEKELIKLQERYDIVAMFDDNELLVPVCKRLWILLLQVHR